MPTGQVKDYYAQLHWGEKMNDLLNPYIAGAPVVEADMFFGRQDVFGWIERSLMGKYIDHILVIHGQRRVGKTSILKQIPNHLPDQYLQVFFDLQGRTNTTLERFLWWLTREITRTLNRQYGLSLSAPDQAAFEADPEILFTHFLPEVQVALGEQVLLLTFDEFDTLQQPAIQESLARPVIQVLRRMMELEGISFIFSIGSSGQKLENMQSTYTDFFKSALYKKISFLDQTDCTELITKPVEGVLVYQPEAVQRIYQVSAGHPYFTQLVCHELFSMCQKTGVRDIQRADVDAVLVSVIERGTVNLKFVWDEADDLEKWVLACLARSPECSELSTLTDTLRGQRVRFSETDLIAALVHMQEKDVLTDKNQFVVELLRLWLRQNRPLERVREELVEV
ncbi:MAG: ATP-binding protein, partial [Anaerolineales bacterium]|nr:ATP-binding protein [Anaerolineales bacterium]